MAMAEGTIKVPGIGPTKRAYVYGTGAVVGGYVAWRWWQAGQERAADAEAAPPPESAGTIGADVGSGEGGYYGTPPIGSDTTVGQPITSNADWFQRAVDYLEGTGKDRAAAADALGLYLDHRALTADQQNLVRVALGAVGTPPTGGPYTLITASAPAPSSVTAPKHLRLWAAPGGGVSATTVPIEWDSVPSAAGYRIYRDLGENIGDSLDTKFYVKGLQPGKSYTFTVRAYNATHVVGPESGKLTVRTKEAHLARPGGVHAVALDRHRVRLSWRPVPGASDGYRAFRRGIRENVGASRDTSMIIAGLKPSTTYYFAVSAVSGPTTGPRSGWARVRTKR